MALPRDQAALVALNRFGLGARPGSRTGIGADPRGAVLAEIDSLGGLPLRAEVPLPGLRETLAAEMQRQRALDQQRAAARSEAARAGGAGMGETGAREMGAREMGAAPPAGPPPAAPAGPPPAQRAMLEETEARFAAAVSAPVGFVERWVAFWSNHFCITAAKSQLARASAGAYERDIIRPRVFGRFADLLLAVETSPPMLHYLDQAPSIGPNSRAGRRRGRGLNENLAREILELHTLGVDGGYAQADVTSFARVLTGWTFAGLRNENYPPGQFFFNANAHEPGAHVVLGRSFPEDGQEQGEAVLAMLAAHPSTARFVARKLARHFVADEPPPAVVDALRTTFLESGGDLRQLARRLLSLDEAWQAPLTKLRSPPEFVAAALRALAEGGGSQPVGAPQISFYLRLMGQPLWLPPGPNGFADTEEALAAPEAIRVRVDIANQIARRRGGTLDPLPLAADLFGDTLSPETRTAIARAESRPQGLALLLSSPEFMRR